jgi:hypothetical protein
VSVHTLPTVHTQAFANLGRLTVKAMPFSNSAHCPSQPRIVWPESSTPVANKDLLPSIQPIDVIDHSASA